VASDWSAVAIHRLPAIPKPPSVPTAILVGSRTSGSIRTCNGRTRFASVQDRWFSTVDDVAVVTPAFAAVDLARRCEPIAALALTDAVARRDQSNAKMLEAWQDVRKWSNINRARLAIDMPMPTRRVRSRVRAIRLHRWGTGAADVERLGGRGGAEISTRSLLGRAAFGRRWRRGPGMVAPFKGNSGDQVHMDARGVVPRPAGGQMPDHAFGACFAAELLAANIVVPGGQCAARIGTLKPFSAFGFRTVERSSRWYVLHDGAAGSCCTTVKRRGCGLLRGAHAAGQHSSTSADQFCVHRTFS
jgi:hypothetical protein